MTRPPYQSRTLLITSELMRETAIQLIRNLPLDLIKPIQVKIGEADRARGLDANGLYWLRLGELAAQGWHNGKQYSSEIWHAYARRHIMPEQIITKDGEPRSKWLEMPDGSMETISTTQLERKCFSEYITLVEVFGAQELGVKFSSNRNEM